MTQAHAAVAYEPGGNFKVETIDVEAPRAGEVRVRITGVGLCHTDLVFRDQIAPFALPGVLGHEGAGVIESIGEGVEGLKVGDEVVVGFSSCGACLRCDEDLPSYCQSFAPLNFAGMRIEDGSTAYSKNGERVTSHFFGQSSFSALTVTPARNVVKVDASAVPLELLGPMGCGFQTGAGGVMRSLACPAGSSIAIFGGGPVGLAAVMAAVIQGCTAIILVEPIAARRDIAIELGATHVIDPAEAGDLAEALLAITPLGLDFAFDTSGISAVIEAGVAALGSHGAIGLVGVPSKAGSAISVDISHLMSAGRRIIGIIEGDSDPQEFIPELIAHHAAGRFPFDKLIKTFPLDQINEAIAAQARGECIKVILIP